MKKLYIGLGSNQGDRIAWMQRACSALQAEGFVRLNSSALYESQSAYYTGAPYYNSVVEVTHPRLNDATKAETAAVLQTLLQQALQIELNLKRQRPNTGYADRTLDIDFITAIDETGALMTVSQDVQPRLELPHPLAYERRFVLQPLADLNPTLPVTKSGLDAAQALSQCKAGAVTRLSVLTDTAGALEPYHHGHTPLPLMIINLTDDSFSDGGHFLKSTGDPCLPTLCAYLVSCLRQGVRWFDLGAESTRPGAPPRSPKQQLERLLPTLEAIQTHALLKNKLTLFIDTRSAEVLERCHQIAPVGLNDVSGLTYDPEMLQRVTALGCSTIICHSRGTPAQMDQLTQYEDFFTTFTAEWSHRLERALHAGLPRWRIFADPGLGFGKNASQNKAILCSLSRWKPHLPQGLGFVWGWSRKRFVNEWTPDAPASVGSWQKQRDHVGVSIMDTLTSQFDAPSLNFYRIHDYTPYRDRMVPKCHGLDFS